MGGTNREKGEDFAVSIECLCIAELQKQTARSRVQLVANGQSLPIGQSTHLKSHRSQN